MRWFVEVSQVGEDAEGHRVCIEARTWQAALQDARRRHGDMGALASFSIELLEEGYRAIDPKTRSRYVVKRAPPGATATNDGELAAPLTPETTSGTAAGGTPKHPEPAARQAASSIATGPTSELIRKRDQEPSARSPLVYRERAYAVRPGTSRAVAEAVLRTRFEEVAAELERRPPGKFVQLAVFDHVFEKKPLRKPLATLAWKDWRGAPNVKFPGAANEPSASGTEAPNDTSAPTTAQNHPASQPAPAGPPRKDSQAAIAAVRRNVHPGRREPGDDLIGELFEAMHELHFVPDVVGGCDFVLEIVGRMLPCEGVLVHVFDINSRNFVVVRARGPAASATLMHETPDSSELVRKTFRRSHAVKFDAALPDHFRNGAWRSLGTDVRSALLGPVLQGGRYLGAIELANPSGGGPFYQSEAHALEYICEQFAEFLASRPIVIDAEAVLSNAGATS